MMGVSVYSPHWLYEALERDPEPKPAHWSIRFAPLIVMVIVGLIGAAAYLAYKGVPL